jgi:DNA-binding NtrC family response regulator
MKAGAFDFVTKPFEHAELKAIIAKAARQSDLNARNVIADEPGRRFTEIIGKGQRMVELQQIIGKVADAPSTVLIQGESGTGKELVATALHEKSARRDKPFIKINCAAIPRELVEAELFGFEKGAFTGAVQSKPGRFELADGGTLFLDEIGEIPVEMQVKLLRAIQESEFERVGGVKTTRVEVRLIAATSPPGGSARISTTVSTSSLCTCRRCATGARTSRSSSSISARSTTRACARTWSASTTTRWRRSPRIPGPETSASWRTCSSARSCSRRRR